jgi:hypothetical protein
MRWRTLVAVAISVVLVTTGAAWLIRRADGGGPVGGGPAGPWRAYPGAFDGRGGYLSGPRVLVADPDGCYAGFGQDHGALGIGPAYWIAAGDCLRPTNVTPTQRPIGDVLPTDDRTTVVAAIAAHGGGFLVVVRHRYFGDAYAYDSVILRGRPTGGWQRIAEFDTDTPRSSHIGPNALVAVERGYVAVGNRERAPVAWISRDGSSWREIALPLPSGSREAYVSSIVTGPDGRLVAVGQHVVRGSISGPAAWLSTDNGATWRSADVPSATGSPRLNSVVRTGRRYLALGAVDGNLGSPALVLASADGSRWAVDRTVAAAGVPYLATALATSDGVVFAVSGMGRGSDGPDRLCATAWRLAAGAWTAEPMGCHGLPTSMVALADGRIAAVYSHTLYLRSPT